MKSVKLLTIIGLSALVMSFTVPGIIKSNSTECSDYKGGGLVFKNEEIDLGKIPQGKPVTVEFQFTNKGETPAIIVNVATSCGCTIADYPKKPILANETSKITATYNASALGAFTKAITVTLENNENKVLQIKGTVVQP